MVELINLTPHALVLRRADGTDVVLPPSGTVARVSMIPGLLDEEEGVPVPIAGRDVFGGLTGLPEPRGSRLYVVSVMVGAVLAGRRGDVVVPGTGPADGVVRDGEGKIVAVTRLKRV